ncbi:MAG: hypothetical protein IJI14_13465 [Anaerolineaceae bacterium]|nr:hypothetical protein [Anaerolineaceae bacterium]
MSNFNSFARELESIAKEGFHNLEKAQDELDQAQAELSKYPQREYVGAVNAETAKQMIAQATAQAKVFDCQKNLKTVKNSLNQNRERISIVRDELEAAVTEAYSVNPKDVDESTILLMKSGICKPSEYETLMKNAMDTGNHTMTRLIGSYAAAEADRLQKKNSYDPNIRNLRFLEQSVDDGSEYLKIFDELSRVVERCFNNPALIPMWDEITAETIEAF